MAEEYEGERWATPWQKAAFPVGDPRRYSLSSNLRRGFTDWNAYAQDKRARMLGGEYGPLGNQTPTPHFASITSGQFTGKGWVPTASAPDAAQKAAEWAALAQRYKSGAITDPTIAMRATGQMMNYPSAWMPQGVQATAPATTSAQTPPPWWSTPPSWYTQAQQSAQQQTATPNWMNTAPSWYTTPPSWMNQQQTATPATATTSSTATTPTAGAVPGNTK